MHTKSTLTSAFFKICIVLTDNVASGIIIMRWIMRKPKIKKLKFKYGEWYHGYALKGVPHGEGEYHALAYLYKGNFENGRKSGYGVIKFEDGYTYEGEWACDDYHGKGKVI